MFVPSSEAELRETLENGLLSETSSFDAKEALPPAGKNRDLARDLCAMTVDGGVLLYGIGGADPSRPDKLVPLDPAGAAERIDQVAQTAIAEPPVIDIRDIASEEQSGKRYLIVAIPASPRAPHMVTLGGENRYYGRGATGNRILSEAEVARLYERRAQWEVDREALLDEAVRAMPFESADPEALPLTLYARPVTASPDLLQRAAGGRRIEELMQELPQLARENDVFPDQGTISIGDAHRHGRRGADAWTIDSGRDPTSSYQARLELEANGMARFWAVPQGRQDAGHLFLLERSAARHPIQFIEIVRHVYDRAGYVGAVDFGVAITDLQQAHGASLHGNRYQIGQPFGAPDYRRTSRVTMTDLEKDPDGLTRQLLAPLFDVIAERDYDIFQGRR